MTDPDDEPMRCSTADRERTASIVYDATREGCLDIVEADERLTAVYAARRRRELDELVADLPVPTTPQPHGWAVVRTAARTQLAADLRILTRRDPDPDGRRGRIILVAVGLLATLAVLLVLLAHGLAPEGDEHEHVGMPPPDGVSAPVNPGR